MHSIGVINDELLESGYTEMPQVSELMKYYLQIPALF